MRFLILVALEFSAYMHYRPIWKLHAVIPLGAGKSFYTLLAVGKCLASNPDSTHPDFIFHPWEKNIAELPNFFPKVKSGQVRPGFKANTCLVPSL